MDCRESFQIAHKAQIADQVMLEVCHECHPLILERHIYNYAYMYILSPKFWSCSKQNHQDRKYLLALVLTKLRKEYGISAIFATSAHQLSAGQSTADISYIFISQFYIKYLKKL